MNVLKAGLVTIAGAVALWIVDGVYNAYSAEIQAAPIAYRALWVMYYFAFTGVTCAGAYHTIRGLFNRSPRISISTQLQPGSGQSPLCRAVWRLFLAGGGASLIRTSSRCANRHCARAPPSSGSTMYKILFLY